MTDEGLFLVACVLLFFCLFVTLCIYQRC